MYRRQVTAVAKEPINQKPLHSTPKATSKRVYELLWRKKTRKVHRSWEGDALGAILRKTNEYIMQISAGGRSMGTVRLGPDLSLLEEGNILQAGSIEVEVGARVEPQRKPLAQSPANLPKKVKVDSTNSQETPQFVSPFPKPSNPSLNPKNPSLKPRDSSQTPQKVLSNLSKPNDLKARDIHDSQFVSPLRASHPVKNSVKEKSKEPDKNVSEKEPLKRLVRGTANFVAPFKTVTPTVLLPSLRPHQLEAVEFMKQSVLGHRHLFGNGCILADEMGLGKTLSSIALIHNLLGESHIRNALIVCPVSLVGNWRQEFRKWLSSDVSGSNIGVLTIDKAGLGNGSIKDPAIAFFKDPQFRSLQVLIVGYERVRNFSAQLAAMNRQFDLVICDEGHRLKSTGSQTADALAEISGEKRIILTGTPIQNHLTEFWALADFVNPGCLFSEAKFNRKFAVPISTLVSQEERSRKETELSEQALSELTEICDEIMLRRTTEVLKNYLQVPRSEFVVFIRPTKRQLTEYASVCEHAVSLLGEADNCCLQMISELKKIAAGGSNGAKIQFLSSLIDVLSTETDEKVVLVSGSTKVLDVCQNLLISKQLQWLRLDGQTPQEKRDSCVRIFNKEGNNGVFAFLLSSRSGGVGLNLIGGSRLVLLDCDWNPAIDTQVMARIHRDGQKRPCFIYRLVMSGTIEEKIFQRQLSKIGLRKNVLVDSLHTGISKSEFTKTMLKDLFTLSTPDRCATLECNEEAVQGYKVTADGDEVLQIAIERAQNVTCVFKADP